MNPILGVDFGRARIGLAISDELRLLAHPLATISFGEGAISRIGEIVQEKKIDRIVVGVPKLLSGKMGTAADEVLRFVEKMRAALSCPVVTWDERLTSVAAQRALRESGKKTHQTRGYIDQVAAQMILQGYLDRIQRSEPGDEIPG
jgi:putative Holliday junction resolvase